VASGASRWLTSSAIAAILGVLSAGVLAGVIIGVVLSVGWLVYVSATPNIPELGRRSGTQVFRSTVEYPDGETYPGLLVMRFDAGLHFGSSDALEDRLRELAEEADPALHTVVIDFEGVNFIDSQGSDKVPQLLDLAEPAGIELRLARVKPHVLALLERDGVIDELGRRQGLRQRVQRRRRPDRRSRRVMRPFACLAAEV
jgi:SulP family sulfate permease